MYHAVIPIFNGMFTVTTVDRPNIPILKDIPSFSFLLELSGGSYALVDTGISPDYIPSLDGFVVQKDAERLNQALTAHGVRPEQVSMVIQTHMHWDHTAALADFPAAEIIVQAAEMQALFQLQPNEDTYYYYDRWITEIPRMRLVNGNIEIIPGIELIYSGGHTPGHQLVRIRTGQGNIILGGDLPYNYDDLWRLPPKKFWEKLRKLRKPKYDWNGELLPAVKRLINQQKMWDAAPGSPLGWKSLREKEGNIWLSHDQRLKAALDESQGRNASNS